LAQPNWGRVAKLRLFQVEHRPVFLDRHGDDVDAPFHARPADGLGAHDPAVIASKDQLEADMIWQPAVGKRHLIAAIEDEDLGCFRQPPGPCAA
jgi:hypothetical protein